MKVRGYEFKFWVLALTVALAVALGVVNNMRVYEEQRVPWLGAEEEEEDDED